MCIDEVKSEAQLSVSTAICKQDAVSWLLAAFQTVVILSELMELWK